MVKQCSIYPVPENQLSLSTDPIFATTKERIITGMYCRPTMYFAEIPIKSPIFLKVMFIIRLSECFLNAE